MRRLTRAGYLGPDRDGCHVGVVAKPLDRRIITGALSGFTSESVEALARDVGYDVSIRKTFSARLPEFRSLPSSLHASVSSLLRARYPEGLYVHQVEAIQASLRGDNVCLATSTSSGKTIVFASVVADLVMRSPQSKALVLYPAKSLIQDQRRKWAETLDPLGISHAFIDGSVPRAQRADILARTSVVLMTPDVVHAWLMAQLGDPRTRTQVREVRLLVLDEAHVYDGAFGTNMAYLLRRFEAAAGQYRFICTTATVRSAGEFMLKLTGRDFHCIGADLDRSGAPERSLLVAVPRHSPVNEFDLKVSLLAAAARQATGRFLAFGDSRRMVERVVAASHRPTGEEVAARTADRTDILPYRSGYEVEDRETIQQALTNGKLRGVVATSALELGLDIGEIDLVVLLGWPPSVKAFWQRLGRAARRRPGVCLVLADRTGQDQIAKRLERYTSGQFEESWLYLDNKFIQYSHALCAAAELSASGRAEEARVAFGSLPTTFRDLVDNELNPKDVVPPDLYALKQQAQSEPHTYFQLRAAVEKSFRIRDEWNDEIGSITLSQALREAYPGAVYYHLARPYRVARVDTRKGEIRIKREKQYSTKPKKQFMVFPQFSNGIHELLVAECGFVAEVDLQVCERVTGFVEQRGAKEEAFNYGPESTWAQRPIDRNFQTTGVCWSGPASLLTADRVVYVVEAFCAKYGVHERDIGVGPFYSKKSPAGPGECRGLAIYDATNGSLRLTQRLAEGFGKVVEYAIELAEADAEESTRSSLQQLLHWCSHLSRRSGVPIDPDDPPAPARAIRVGSQAVLLSNGEPSLLVVVKDRRIEAGTLVYIVAPVGTSMEVTVPGDSIRAIDGLTTFD